MNISQWKNGDRTFFSLEVDDQLLLLTILLGPHETGDFIVFKMFSLYCKIRIENDIDYKLIDIYNL